MKQVLILAILISSLKSFSIKKDSILPLFEDLKKRTLLVCLEKEDAKYIEKLTKKQNESELKFYKKALQLTNENFVMAVKNFWTLNTKIKFILTDSLDWYTQNNSPEYAYLTFRESSIHMGGAINVGIENIQSVSNMGLKLYLCGRKMPIATCIFPVDEVGHPLPVDEKKDNILYSENYVSAPKLIFVIHRFNWLYLDALKNPKITQENAIYTGGNDFNRIEELKSQTIYVRLHDCEKNFDLEKVKKYYPYAIKIVSDDEFEKAMMNKEPNVVCIFILVAGGSTMGNETASITRMIYMQSAVNASDGSITTCFAGNFGFCNDVAAAYGKYIKKFEKKK
jgi:hypothetical protein